MHNWKLLLAFAVWVVLKQLLDTWQFSEDNVHHRQETVRQIDALRNRLFKKYGEMADSVELIRDDRGR